MLIGDNMTLEDVKGALDSNTSLNDEIRDNIYSLVYIFHEKYPNISLNNLVNNLKTLKIIKSNKFINKRISKYNNKTNILEFNIDEINRGYDMQHVMMYSLLEIITNNGIQVGFNKNNQFIALHAGYTEILANNLVGNDSDIEYLSDEIITTNMIALMVGNDILFNSYFNNDAESLIKSLLTEGVEVSE